MKRIALIALVVVAAKVAYELIRQQRSPKSLPDGAPYEPAPVPKTSKAPEPSTVATAPAATAQAPVPATTEPPSPVPETAPAERDDMTRVRGIGPVYAGKLRELGITTFTALVSSDTEALAGNLDVPPAMVANWQNQARGMRS